MDVVPIEALNIFNKPPTKAIPNAKEAMTNINFSGPLNEGISFLSSSKEHEQLNNPNNPSTKRLYSRQNDSAIIERETDLFISEQRNNRLIPFARTSDQQQDTQLEQKEQQVCVLSQQNNQKTTSFHS